MDNEDDVKRLQKLFKSVSKYKDYPIITVKKREEIHFQFHEITGCSKNCPLKHRPRIGEPRRYFFYAFLRFYDEQDTELAYCRLHESLFDDTTIELEWCKSSICCSYSCYENIQDSSFIHSDHLHYFK